MISPVNELPGGRYSTMSSFSWLANRLPRVSAWFDRRRNSLVFLGGPFNGQSKRQEMITDLLGRFQPAAIVETGTYRAETTEWLARSFSGPIRTIEINRRLCHFARWRVRDFPQVEVLCGDSRVLLGELISQPLISEGPTLFYLDAHWRELPFFDEMNKISEGCRDAVVVVDDFEVHGDAGYGYDDYGEGQSLSLDNLHPDILESFDIYFPVAPSESESGAKRGCVVFSSGASAHEAVRTCSALRPAVV